MAHRVWCKLHIKVHAHCQKGETVVVSGDPTQLGSFAPSQAVHLHTNPEEYPVWTASTPIMVPFGINMRYKYAIFSGGTIRQWEPVTGDRVVTTSRSELFLDDKWGSHTASSAPGAASSTAPIAARTLSGSAAGPRFLMGQDPRVIAPGVPVSSPMLQAMARPGSQGPIQLGQEGGLGASPPDVMVGGMHDILGGMAGSARPPAVRFSAPTDSHTSGGAEGGAGRPPPLPRSDAGETTAMLANRRMVVVSYHLPVILRRGENGTWVATWDVDNFLARSKHSVASEISVMWVGCVTRRCLDAVTGKEGTRAHRSSDVSRVSSDELPGEARVSPELRPAPVPGAGPLTTIHTVPVAPGSGSSTAPAYRFRTPSGEGGQMGGETHVHIPAQGLGSSPPFTMPPSGGGGGPGTGLDSPAAVEPDEEGVLDLTPADREGIRAALQPMNVVPIFLGHDNVVFSPSSPTDTKPPMELGEPAPGAYTDRQEQAAYRQLVPEHALEEEEAEATAVAITSCLHKGVVRDYSAYCTGVLRSAMNNVLDMGNNTSGGNVQSVGDGSHTSRMYRLRHGGWKAYTQVNEYVAQVAAACLRPGDIVWTHDYHMCMVPHFLARAVSPPPPQVFYMHASWPTSEVFRSLAEREHLLNGMLQADVIGFHTFNHARHFLQCCKRLLGLNYASRGGRLGLDCRGRDVMVDISHMGVDVPVLDGWMASTEAAAFARQLRQRYPNRIILGGFDVAQRLSGVALKLLAFERLLEENPRYVTKLVLVQRCELRDAMPQDAARTSREIRTLVERIRRKHGPVVDYAEAVAFPPTLRIGLFHCADVLLHTPVREGLNLVPLQYVYVRTQWELQRAQRQEAGVKPAVETGAAPPPPVHLRPPTGRSADDGSGTKSAGRSGTSTAQLASHYATAGRSSRGLAAAAREAAGKGGGDRSGSIMSLLGSMFSGFRNRPSPPARTLAPSIPEEGGDGEEDVGGARPIARGLGGIALTGGYDAPSGAAPVGEREVAGGEDSSSVGGSVATVSPALSGRGGDMLRVSSLAELQVPVSTAALVAPLPPPPRGGCVVLSEASTASHILNSHIVVNPFALGEMATAMDKALRMEDRERALRQMRDYLYATRNPSYKWARQILVDVLHSRASHGAGQFVEMEASEVTTFSRRTTLGGGADEAAPASALRADVTRISRSPSLGPAVPGAGALPPPVGGLPSSAGAEGAEGAELLPLDKHALMANFAVTSKRLVFLDWGGTLIEREGTGTYVKHEFIGRSGRKRLPSAVLASLKVLTEDPGTTVWVVTGLTPDVLQSSPLLLLPNINIAAENGAVMRRGSGVAGVEAPWTRTGGPLSPEVSAEWDSVVEVAQGVMREYQWRVSGATIRTSPTSVVFDHRNADPEWAQAQAKFLTKELARRLASPSILVRSRKGRVEVSLRGATRRDLVLQGLAEHPDTDFVMAVGDDASDEEMFETLMQAVAAGQGSAGRLGPTGVYTITVGRKRTGARHFLPDVAHVQLVLKGMAELTVALKAGTSSA